jgi:hypothetical protein
MLASKLLSRFATSRTLFKVKAALFEEHLLRRSGRLGSAPKEHEVAFLSAATGLIQRDETGDVPSTKGVLAV